MAIIKCKMCGGDLNIIEGASTAECEFCGSVQTVPKVDDEKKLTLFARANRLRAACEFDKAAGIYEAIVADFQEEAEAYWGLVLCKYGIEYVDDPATGKKIPTCHRSSFDSIMEDSDFEQALENADGSARKVYRDEAKAIEEIRKGIIAVSANEQPYDIFICYKETSETGDRTLDSVLAQDVYDALTDKGYRVFFSRVTLEDKLGMEYEPYIFAALNSAKIMLAFGTDYEYYNAVWVRNEWSRFLKLMEKDKEKHLIPCYKGINAYDMPKEFAKLQAQDLGKVGAVQDLLRGIEKLLPRREKATETVVVQQTGNPNTAPLLERAFMFLEDGDWERADEFCEQVLNLDPKNAQAYVGKLMAELHIRKQDSLKDCAEPFDRSNNYQKAIRFGNDQLKATLTGYIEYINTRNENAHVDRIYKNAKNAMAAAHTESDYKKAAQIFETVGEYLDSTALAKECYEKEEAVRLERERMAELDRQNAEKRAKTIKKFAAIATPIVCAVIAFVVVLNTVIIPTQKRKVATEKYGEEFVAEFESLNVGDIYKFGTYEQDNDVSNGAEEIEWLVLQDEGTKILVISQYALDCKQYNTSYTDVTWETCSLRQWLNNDFIDIAFSADEKTMIPTVTVSADKNPNHSTDPGNATQDQVFLLSVNEANKYFASDSARMCMPTNYAIANGVNESDSGNCWWWWLRSPGSFQRTAAAVNFDGGVYMYDYSPVNENIAVRPALWIDLNA